MNDSLKVSIAMTSYNGEKFIIKQLDSFRKQTRQPDEVIICDDGSTDNTYLLVKNYIIKYNLTGWKILRNDSNIGWMRNFYKASSLTTGDIIFFSDQDDIWLPEKIEVMTKALVKQHMGVLVCEAEIIDGQDRLQPNRMIKSSFSNETYQHSFSKSFYSVKTLGCCMCLSRELLNIYIRLDYPEGGHDSQCGRLALLYSSLWHIDKPLIQYRIHETNTSGVSEEVSFGAATNQKRTRELKNTAGWISRLISFEATDDRQKTLLKECLIAVKMRITYLEGKTFFFSLLKYKAFYPNLTMLLGDFAYRHGVNTILGKVRWNMRKS